MRAALASLMLTGLALSGCTSVSGGLGWPLDRGRALAQDKCASCHTISGTAQSPDPKAPPFAQIGARYSEAGLDRELEVIAQMGHYSMPPTPLSKADRDSLAAYIQSRLPG
jgi:cytochrome c